MLRTTLHKGNTESYVIVGLHNLYTSPDFKGYQLKEAEMGGTCSTHVGDVNFSLKTRKEGTAWEIYEWMREY
jgi:hypothetical protein